jgi:hypothetical protein
VCFDFLYNLRLKHFSFYDEVSEIWSKMSGGLHVKHPLFLSDLNETYSLDIFSKNIKLHENPSSRSRFVPCGETDGRKNMTKLTVAFRNFAKAPKNVSVLYVTPFHVHSTEKELLFLP